MPRGKHSVGFYSALNDLSTADIYTARPSRKKRKLLKGEYKVERVVAMKKGKVSLVQFKKSFVESCFSKGRHQTKSFRTCNGFSL